MPGLVPGIFVAAPMSEGDKSFHDEVGDQLSSLKVTEK
jgi:hypothetical protein